MAIGLRSLAEFPEANRWHFGFSDAHFLMFEYKFEGLLG
jgi:hypothetical protein